MLEEFSVEGGVLGAVVPDGFGAEIAMENPAVDGFVGLGQRVAVMGFGNIFEALLDGAELRHPAGASDLIFDAEKLDMGGLVGLGDLENMPILAVFPKDAEAAVGAVEVVVIASAKILEDLADDAVAPFGGEVDGNRAVVVIAQGRQSGGDDQNFAALARAIGVDLKAKTGLGYLVVRVKRADFLQGKGLFHRRISSQKA